MFGAILYIVWIDTAYINQYNWPPGQKRAMFLKECDFALQINAID